MKEMYIVYSITIFLKQDLKFFLDSKDHVEINHVDFLELVTQVR